MPIAFNTLLSRLRFLGWILGLTAIIKVECFLSTHSSAFHVAKSRNNLPYVAFTRLATSLSGTTDEGDPFQAQKLVYQGMDAFRRGDIAESINLFDQAEAERPSITPYLWQRGISYYYADRFAEASQQFQVDVNVNPVDVEEIVWDIASQYRLKPDEKPTMMSLPKGKRDPRRIMVSTRNWRKSLRLTIFSIFSRVTVLHKYF